MSTSELLLSGTSIISCVGAVILTINNRRKPVLDTATAQKAFVDSDAVKQEIKRMSEESNIRRDLRILDLENWGEDMRPWVFAIKERNDVLYALIREDRKMLGLDMPDIPPLPPTPIFPPPRPLPPSS